MFQAGTGTGPNALTSASGQLFSRNSPTPTGKGNNTTLPNNNNNNNNILFATNA